MVCKLTAGVRHFSSVSLTLTTWHSSLPTVTVVFSLKPKPVTVSSVPPEENMKVCVQIKLRKNVKVFLKKKSLFTSNLPRSQPPEKWRTQSAGR